MSVPDLATPVDGVSSAPQPPPTPPPAPASDTSAPAKPVACMAPPTALALVREDGDSRGWDRFGFILPRSGVPVNPAPSRSEAKVLTRRYRKWEDMLRTWDSPKCFRFRHAKRFKRRVRKGIPNELRGECWAKLCGSEELLRSNPGLYERLTVLPPPVTAGRIDKDLDRTFPDHRLFRQAGGVGQQRLRRVLEACSHYDPVVGYCQGMGFVAATLLMYQPEELAFWTLVRMLHHFDMVNLFREGLPKFLSLCAAFSGLASRFVPKLWAHLEAGVTPDMYLSQWFQTLFVYAFPAHFAMRVWDAFFHEGWKVCLRVALALLKSQQKALLATSGIENLLPRLSRFPPDVSAEEVLRVAYKLPLSRKHIVKYTPAPVPCDAMPPPSESASGSSRATAASASSTVLSAHGGAHGVALGVVALPAQRVALATALAASPIVPAAAKAADAAPTTVPPATPLRTTPRDAADDGPAVRDRVAPTARSPAAAGSGAGAGAAPATGTALLSHDGAEVVSPASSASHSDMPSFARPTKSSLQRKRSPHVPPPRVETNWGRRSPTSPPSPRRGTRRPQVAAVAAMGPPRPPLVPAAPCGRAV